MSIRSGIKSSVLALSLLTASFGVAQAGCVSKSAQATSYSKASAKWFAMETMVQAVSWGLWPGWVATGVVDGYSVKSEKYKCTPGSDGVTCISWAKFCKK